MACSRVQAEHGRQGQVPAAFLVDAAAETELRAAIETAAPEMVQAIAIINAARRGPVEEDVARTPIAVVHRAVEIVVPTIVPDVARAVAVVSCTESSAAIVVAVAFAGGET